MLQYYRAMPQLSPLKKTKSVSIGPITTTAQMKLPDIPIDVPTLIVG
jgi:hypothetical protein